MKEKLQETLTNWDSLSEEKEQEKELLNDN
jgi:hypothetical protein